MIRAFHFNISIKGQSLWIATSNKIWLSDGTAGCLEKSKDSDFRQVDTATAVPGVCRLRLDYEGVFEFLIWAADLERFPNLSAEHSSSIKDQVRHCESSATMLL